MPSVLLAALSCLFSPGLQQTAPPPPPQGPEDSRAQVRLDPAHHEVIVTAGPFRVRSMPEGMNHADMAMMDDHNTPVYRFEWPLEGWLRGFTVEILDANNQPIDRRLVHHLIVINFDRRQLLYPAYERVFGIGQETENVSVPKTIGIPMKAGTRLGLYLAWANQTETDLEGIQLRLRLAYSPPNLTPRPVDALPLYMDVNLTVGKGDDFDVPPGRSEKSWEFAPSVGGRILGVGGHLHDYGVGLRLEDAETGKVLTQVASIRTADGKVTRIERKLFGVSGQGLRLRAGHRYRVVGIYDNPTGAMIKSGAMAHMVGLFVPDDYSKWPLLDQTDPTLQDDLAFLTAMGGGSGGRHVHQ